MFETAELWRSRNDDDDDEDDDDDDAFVCVLKMCAHLCSVFLFCFVKMVSGLYGFTLNIPAS